MRRVTIVIDENGSSAMEGLGEIHGGLLPAEVLGAWVYANRHSLGIEIELITCRGVFHSPKEIELCAL